MCVATSTAHTPAAWIQVSGGAWIPDEVTMSQVSTGLQTYAEAMAKRQGRDLLPWSEYSFQYQGRVSKGQKFIYVLALCATVGEPDLHSTFHEVLDGGSCFFALTFDPKSQRFEHFRINAFR
jgi:hypothetical protein